MKRIRRRHCLHCGQLFVPDPRNRYHQRYCRETACRQASKTASQRRWLAKAGNRDYFRDPLHVQRVQAWRAQHCGYGHRPKRLKGESLQDHIATQAVESIEKNTTLTEPALQDLIDTQAYVLIGLIANLTGSALQEDIARSGRRLQQLGRDILFCGGGDEQSLVMSRADTPVTGPV